MIAQLSEAAVTVAAPFDEPAKWAVLVMFDGEVLGTLRELHLSEPAVRARAAELRHRYPRHEIRVVRRTVVWTDEGRVPEPAARSGGAR